MSSEATSCPSTGSLPRKITDSILWTGRCLLFEYKGGPIHSHLSAFVVLGSEKTMLIDTGLVAEFPNLLKDVETFLDGRPLDYLFPTHCELPHCGAIEHWIDRYPDCEVVGNVRDFDLYYPRIANRLNVKKAGDSIDLGNRRIVFVPAVWQDLPSLWAFDTKDRVLFVSDGFAFLHKHEDGQCDLFTGEHPAPDVESIKFFNQLALQWTRYFDAELTFNDIDQMLGQLQPRMIAPAHGGVINMPEELLPLIKEGMRIA
ncbi:MAG: MBL fold metallo-hydrolase [Rhizobiaceae bacterium]|nr:MBL fold metallo-hydrolase [Rhizobiaceae bacterium]